MDAISGIQGVTGSSASGVKLDAQRLGDVPVFDVSKPAVDNAGLNFSDRLWNQVGKVSTQLDTIFEGGSKVAELRHSTLQSLQPTGDMTLDMRNASLAQSEAMMKVAELQSNMTRGQAIFSIAMGMVQAVQGGVSKLFQDK